MDKKIGLFTATIIGMNAMIGAGIFSIPAALASNVGPVGVLTYVLVAISVWFIAQSLSRLTELFPEEGSFYVYPKKWAGHFGGLLTSFSYFLSMIIGMGLLCKISGIYLKTYFPDTDTFFLGKTVLAGLSFLNILGVTISQFGQITLIFFTVFPLLVVTILGLTKFNYKNLFPFAPYGIKSVFSATRTVIFGFFGFEAIASLFNIVKNPKKNISRALTYSITLVSIIYILFVSSIIFSVPLNSFSSAELPLSQILKINFPEKNWLIELVHLSILSAILGTIHSMIWASGELLVSIFKRLNIILNNKIAVFIVATGILISFSILKDIDLFFSLAVIFIVFAYVMSMITLLTIKEEWKSGQNIKTLIGISTASMIFTFAVLNILKF